MLNIFLRLANEFVQGLEFLLGGFVVRYQPRVAVPEQTPELLEEAVYTVDTLGIPGFCLLDRAQEHLVQTQGICPIRIANLVRIHHIVHALGHLFNGPAADVLAVFQHKFRIFVVRTPGAEGLDIQFVVVHNVHIHMHGDGLVLVLEARAHELVGAGNQVHKVGASLDHALVDELAEGFVLAHITQVIEEFVPETAVDEVAGGMLRTAHIKVYVAPVGIGFLAHQALPVVRVHVAQVIGAGAGETGHGTGFQRIAVIRPVLGTGQRRLPVLRGFILVYLRQRERQGLQRQRRGDAILVINGERLPPVPLARENGVADAVIDFAVADSMLFHIVDGGGNSLFYGESVQETAVAHDAFLGIQALLADIGPLDEGNDGKAELFGEGIVTAVMRRNRHNGTGAVTGQHVFRNPYRHLFAGKRIDTVRAGEYARNGLTGNAFALRFLLHLLQIGLYLRFLGGAGELRNPLAFRRQHHEGYAKDGIGPGGEDGNVVLLAVAGDLKHHFCALAAANPVALHLLEGVGPVQFVQPVQQTAGIGAHAELPLGHFLLEHRVTAALGEAVLHLIVGQYGSQGRAPVHRAFSLIGKPIAHEDIRLFFLGKGLPLPCRKGCALTAGSIHGGASSHFEGFYQVLDGAGFLELVVVPGAKHLQEGPLGPFVILRIRGAELAVPVKGKANAVQLLTITGHILPRGLFRMLAGLDGILLCRQTKGVVAHGVQHIETFQSLVPGEDVAGDIAQRMPYVQARAAGVREHVQHIILGFIRLVGSAVGLVLGPPLLPFFLNLRKIIVHS